MDGIHDCCTYPDQYYLDCESNCLNDTDSDGVCDELEIIGCQDGLACNFDSEATDSGECYYLELSTFVDENIQNVTCFGDANGGFAIYTIGGNGPYTLLIDQPPLEMTSDAGAFVVSGVSGGAYDVFIRDTNGCETLETVDVEEPGLIDITIDYLNFISCSDHLYYTLNFNLQLFSF